MSTAPVLRMEAVRESFGTSLVLRDVDPDLVGEALGLVREVKDEGMTMVIATHEMTCAREVADHACFLDAGVVRKRGTPQEVFGAPREKRTQTFLRRIVEAGGCEARCARLTRLFDLAGVDTCLRIHPTPENARTLGRRADAWRDPLNDLLVQTS